MRIEKTKDNKFNIISSGRRQEACFKMPEKDSSKQEVESLYQKYLITKADEDKWDIILSIPNTIMKYASKIEIVYGLYDVEDKKTSEDAFVDLCLRLFDAIDLYKPSKYDSIKNYLQQKCSSRVMCEEGACIAASKFIEENYGSIENAHIQLGEMFSNAINEEQEASDILEGMFLVDRYKEDLDAIKYGIGEKHYKSLLKYYDGSYQSDISRQRCEQLRRNARAILEGNMLCLRNTKMQEIRESLKDDDREQVDVVDELVSKYVFKRDKARYIYQTKNSKPQNALQGECEE